MSHNSLLKRIRAEYLEMPGLQLTLEQAQRLCGAERALCQGVLHALVEARFLRVKPNGTYARVSDGADNTRPHPAKARLNANLPTKQAS